MTTAEQLLHEFNAGHLGPAHGIAKVLGCVADTCGDPETGETISRATLLRLAAELTADLPAPYGRDQPPVLDVLQALAHDWINRHGIFRTVSPGGQKERIGTDWGMVITEAARWGQRRGWDARGELTTR